MKKFVAILLIIVLVFSLASVAFAKNDVVSPENGNTDVPGKPTSPQTSDYFNYVWVIVVAVLSMGVALFCGKKLVSNH